MSDEILTMTCPYCDEIIKLDSVTKHLKTCVKYKEWFFKEISKDEKKKDKKSQTI